MGSESDEDVNILKNLLEQAENLDLTDPSVPREEQTDPGALMIPGLEISKMLAVIEYALLHSLDEDGILTGLDMMSRMQAVKAINGTFQLNIKPSEGSGLSEPTYFYYVDMRKGGTISAGPAPKRPKPDVILTVSDKDMVALAMGKLNPQMAFLKGRIKVKGNIMLGLRLQNVLLAEVNKMQRISKL